jgi:hypothetical protein
MQDGPAAMIRTALDSDQLDAFSAGTDFIITYSDLVNDAGAFESRHPLAQVVYIDRGQGDPGYKASIIDVETGLFQPDHIPGWYDAKVKARIPFLTFYCNRSSVASCQAVLGGRHMWEWIATLDGTMAIAGYTPLFSPALIQVAGSNMTGIHADFSLVLSPSWHPTPSPQRLAAALNTVEAAARSAATVAGDLNSVMGTLKSLQ